MTAADSSPSPSPPDSALGSPRAARLSRAFWVGLGVPLAIVLLAFWQWRRALGDPLDPTHLLTKLAATTLAFGLMAAVIFCVAVVLLRRSAARALQSRDALLTAFDGGRRWLPVFMLVQALLIFAGLIGLIAYEFFHLVSNSNAAHLSSGAMKLVILALLFVLLLLWFAIKIVWDTIGLARRKHVTDPIQIMGRSLSREQAPLLWDFVAQTARRADAQMPDSVVVGLNEGFFVTEHPVVLVSGDKAPTGRVLYLPLPYMAFLRRDEVAAIIAHELGHFIGEDTRYSLRFTPIYRDLTDAILAITNEHQSDDDGWRALMTAPASLFGKWFLQSFDEAVHHWSRVREFAADRCSGRVAGTDAAARALLRSAVLQGIVDEALLRNREASAQRREGVLAMVRRFVGEQGLSDPHQHLEEHQAHPLDTHPTLKQRLAALGVAITPDLVAQTRDPCEAQLLVELGLETARS
jgi:Zn-dependent protease with chaperone function